MLTLGVLQGDPRAIDLVALYKRCAVNLRDARRPGWGLSRLQSTIALDLGNKQLLSKGNILVGRGWGFESLAVRKVWIECGLKLSVENSCQGFAIPIHGVGLGFESLQAHNVRVVCGFRLRAGTVVAGTVLAKEVQYMGRGKGLSRVQSTMCEVCVALRLGKKQ